MFSGPISGKDETFLVKASTIPGKIRTHHFYIQQKKCQHLKQSKFRGKIVIILLFSIIKDDRRGEAKRAA